jgi:hypothetical protein
MAARLTIGLLIGLLIFVSPANAKAPINPRPSSEDIRLYVVHEAQNAHVSPSLALNIISCESGWNSLAKGDLGTSWGLVQVHLPAHPNITKTEALDPYWSADYLIKELAAGKGSQWSCYRMVAV